MPPPSSPGSIFLISPATIDVLGTRVHATSYNDAVDQVGQWLVADVGRYICAANVHMVMEGRDDPSFQRIVNAADLATPDGMPLVWFLRKRGVPNQEQVKGPSLMLHLIRRASEHRWRVGLYGGDEKTLELLSARLRTDYPNLDLAYVYSPPFRALSNEEDEAIVEAIRAARVQILFVGLGCPKQERWMAEHRDRLPCVMAGVGAAFSFHAGTVRPAPEVMRKAGLEWLFRLCMEPRRLWRRYAKHNPRFMALALRDGLARKKTAGQ